MSHTAFAHARTLDHGSGQSLVNYSAQINAAHTACLAAKELGGKKAHECGTWLIKQKEAVPYGEWIKWIEENCSFGKRHAQKYMEIAKLEAPRDTETQRVHEQSQ